VLVVTLLLSTAALVLLTALGAGMFLFMAAGSMALKESEAHPAQAAPDRPSFEPDTRDAQGGPLARSGDGPSRPPGPVNEEEDLILGPAAPAPAEQHPLVEVLRELERSVDGPGERLSDTLLRQELEAWEASVEVPDDAAEAVALEALYSHPPERDAFGAVPLDRSDESGGARG
jgi:hypothetical protein